MCLGAERQTVSAGQAVFIPPGEYHQLTNTGDGRMVMMYCYGPAGDVDHWKQELAGTLPREGVDVPPLPEGAWRIAPYAIGSAAAYWTIQRVVSTVSGIA